MTAPVISPEYTKKQQEEQMLQQPMLATLKGFL